VNQVAVDLDNGIARISAGATNNEVVEAAYATKAHIVTGVCGGIGNISAIIGSGVGLLNSLYGLGVDNVISARLVRPSGEIVNTSSTEHPDLWWGLRGAGHKFGIISELTVKAYPQVNDGMYWTGTLIFPGAEPVVESILRTLRDSQFGAGDICSSTDSRLATDARSQPLVRWNPRKKQMKHSQSSLNLIL